MYLFNMLILSAYSLYLVVYLRNNFKVYYSYRHHHHYNYSDTKGTCQQICNFTDANNHICPYKFYLK